MVTVPLSRMLQPDIKGQAVGAKIFTHSCISLREVQVAWSLHVWVLDKLSG